MPRFFSVGTPQTGPLTPRLIIGLMILTLLALVPGIWEATGLSGKDEYFLGLRTPMEMMERGDWLVPFLDGAPRIRKPPLLYWLGRGSYELFGISLSSARLITVLFAALMVVATTGIARRLIPELRPVWLPAAILLSSLGLHTEGRRFMLDIPVAALSTAAFWAWLSWQEHRQTVRLTLVTLLLAAGFMIKGPVVLLVFAGGVFASLLVNAANRRALTSPAVLWQGAGQLCLLVLLCAPWFWWVRHAYPDAVNLVVADEVGSRQFMNLTPGIVFGLLNISLPWFFVFLAALWGSRRQPSATHKMLLLWFAITFLPFLFFKSFDRYLLGSLVPLSLLVAMTLQSPENRPTWAFRAGFGVALLLGGALAAFCLWFDLGGWYWLILPLMYFGWAWGHPRQRSLLPLLLAPALYWMALMWLVFPALGVGRIPPDIVTQAQTRSVAFFDGPQPAMLPILSGQAHRHYAKLPENALAALGDTPLFAEEPAFSRLQKDAALQGLQLQENGCFLTLASHGSGIRFVRPGATSSDWTEAIRRHDLAPLQTRICAFLLVPVTGPAP